MTQRTLFSSLIFFLDNYKENSCFRFMKYAISLGVAISLVYDGEMVDE